jgi:hypothetical protein
MGKDAIEVAIKGKTPPGQEFNSSYPKSLSPCLTCSSVFGNGSTGLILASVTKAVG